MKLVSLELQEWRSFADLQLEFPDGLIGIRGANGAGKTTIAEAIGWALFGKLRNGARVGDLRRQDAPAGRKSTVTLTFRLGATVYRVERVVSGSAKLWIGDADEPETTQVHATNQAIGRALDMTWETFQRTVFAQQKDVAALDPGQRGEDRKRHVERLLGLERYRVAAEKAKARGNELKQQLAGLREGAADLDALRAQLRQAEDSAASGDPAVAQAQRQLDDAQERCTAAEKTRDLERANEERHRRLTADQQRLAKDIDEMQQDLTRKRESLALRRQQEHELHSLNGHDSDLEALARVRRCWEELEQAAGAVDRCRAACPDDVDLSEVAARRERLDAAEAEYRDLLEEDLPDVERLRRRVQALEAAQGVPTVEVAQARAHELRDRLDGLNARCTAIDTRLDENRAHLDAILAGDADASCPACLRPYGDDRQAIIAKHRDRLAEGERERERLRAERDAVKDECAAAEQTLQVARDAARDLQQTAGADDLGQARAALAAAEAQAERRRTRLAELTDLQARLRDQVGADEIRRAEVERVRAELAAAETRFGELAAELQVTAFDPARKEAAVADHQRAVAAAERRTSLTAALEATGGLAGEVEQLEERLRARREEANHVDDELRTLAYDPQALTRAGEALDFARHEVESARQALLEAQVAARQRDSRVRELRDKVTEAQQQHARIADREREVREYNTAVTILNDFRTAQHRRAWPKLEIGASSLLSQTTEGRYADVRLSDDYKLVIVDRGEEHGLQRYSGGEQDLANLCLRIAIAQWVSRERGAEVGFIVLDEVFGSQDEDRRRNLLAQLRELSQQFHQMLVITHLPDIADLCEHHLTVELAEEGRSVARFEP